MEINGTRSEVVVDFLIFSVQQYEYSSCSGNALFLILLSGKLIKKSLCFSTFQMSVFHFNICLKRSRTNTNSEIPTPA